jgi:hypothetical protein
MHKKDLVKEVIEKYVSLGRDFFELTPGYLVTIDELKGFSERTLKRGRTEYKNAHRDLLKGKSKASLNLKKKVFGFLKENPDSSLDQLKSKFSSQDKKQISEFFNLWEQENQSKLRKKAGKKEKADDPGSLRQKVFSHLENNPDLTLSKLEIAFQDDNKKTISNYLDQWRKERSDKRKKISTKQRITDFLDSNPASTLKSLKSTFPDINPSSIGAYHSLWKNNKNTVTGKLPDDGVQQHQRNREPSGKSTLTIDSARQIIEALHSTVEAQKKAIEVLKSQNTMLEEIRTFSFPELKGMSKKEIDKFERMMATFLKGLRNS